MRIKEEIKKSGYFWLPSTPDKKAPGTLSISDGGHIELEVIEWFGDGVEVSFNADLKPIERIVGRTEEGEPVTLDGCFYKKLPSLRFLPLSSLLSLTGSAMKSLIRVSRVLIGATYDEDEPTVFNTLTFSVEGIDEWVGISGISLEPHFEESTATISYQYPAEVSLNLDNGMQLLITFGLGTRISRIKEARISQKTYFILTSQNARELEDFISVVRKITRFLCFAIDQTVSLDSMSATSDNLRRNIGDGTTALSLINIYFSSRPYSTDEPKIQEHNMLFGFGRIQSDVEKKIKNWIEAYEDTYPAFDLYFSAKRDEQRHLDEKFLTLARGLEAYHKRKFDEGSVPLDQRIKGVIEPFKTVIGDKAKQNDLINKIAQKRNNLTHSNLDLDPQTVDTKDLWTLYLKIELLFQLRLLWSIGFSLEDINSIVANCGQLQWKLNQQF